MSDDECEVEFRFLRNDIHKLIDVIDFPNTFTCYNGLKLDAVVGICIFLKRFGYPCRYLDMIPRFKRPVPKLCLISNLVMDHVYAHWNHLLSTFNQPWLSANCLKTFANAIFQKSEHCRTVQDLSMELSDQFPTRVVINESSTVVGYKFRPTLILRGLSLAGFLRQARPFRGLVELVAGII